MNIYKLLETIKIIDNKDPIDSIDILGIANHTDNVEKDFIYVAIKGFITDGHKYITKAKENGAKIAIVEEIIEDVNIAQYKVENTRDALAILSDKFYNHPTKHIDVIGVTATNGKTSTTYMLNQIYEKAGYKTGLIGSVMNKIGDEFVPAELTTPESVDLQRIFYGMKEEKVEKVFMEVSSSALELSRVKNVDFKIVSFNNFSREHIDQHGSFEKYWAAKSSIIKEANEKTYCVLNLDDSYSKSLIHETKGKVITHSIKNKEGNIYCKDLELAQGRASFTVVINKEFQGLAGNIKKGEFRVNLGVPGYHSVANSMAAITIALIDGVSPKAIKAALADFKGVERRFQYIYEDEFIIIDDHFANRGNINVTLETLYSMDYNKLHLIYAIRGSRGTTVNKENAETVLAWKDRLRLDEIIATKSIGDVTFRDRVSEEEEDIFKEVMHKGKLKYYIYDDLHGAIGHALEEVEKDDIILLAGCQGMDHGARIALNILHKMKPEIPRDELFKIIKNRVAV